MLQVTSVAGGVITGVTPVNQVQGENESPPVPRPKSLVALTTKPPPIPSLRPLPLARMESSLQAQARRSTSRCPQARRHSESSSPTKKPPSFATTNSSPTPMLWTRSFRMLGFISAARLSFQLSGDKALANSLIGLANNMIMEARKADGNEGITKNDVTPDFIRIRGVWGGPGWESSFNGDFDWGDCYAPY